MLGKGILEEAGDMVDVNGPVEELILLSTVGKDSLEIPQVVLAVFSADISWFG